MYRLTVVLAALQALQGSCFEEGTHIHAEPDKSSKGIQLPPEPSDKSTPVQQRLSFHGINSISVSWNTYKKLSQPCVKYGTEADDLSLTACSGMSITYPTSRTWSNHVVLNELYAATTYYYKIVSTNSEVHSFQTAREAGDLTPFTMSMYGDLGLYGKGKPTVSKRDMGVHVEPTVNHSTIGHLAKTIDDYEFVFHVGDIAYADDWMYDSKNKVNPGGPEAYTAIIERFYDQLAPISSRKPYMVGPGNHEADCTEDFYQKGDCPKGQYNFSDYRNRFNYMMPTVFGTVSDDSSAMAASEAAKRLAQPPFWYSFDYGQAHFVMINTETDFKNAPDAPGGSYHLQAGPFGKAQQQIEFLKADLASVDRTITPWVIVGGHRPWYSNGKDAGCGPCQIAFEDIIYKYGVDLATFGHVHNLQRFMPMYQNKTDPAGLNNPKAPMYMIVGGAGNIEGHSPIKPKVTGNVFAYNDNYGIGTLTFYNTTHLGVNIINSESGKILDTAVLYKEHSERFVRQ